MKEKYSEEYHLEMEWLTERFNLDYIDSELTENGIKQAQ
jgi:hypothetical protein